MRSPSRYLLPMSVFATGASVLIVEVLAVRVLSPYYGNTIFTVSSVISVILLSLSIGYWLGGVLAERRPSLAVFFGIILTSGLLILALNAVGRVVLPRLSSVLSLTLGPLVSSSVLFLLPALLMGTLSPYAVKLQSIYVPEAGIGRVAGSIFFWSTLGSITGSLLAGFVLIPTFGIDRILVSTGIGLVALGFVALATLRLTTTGAYASVGLMALLLVVNAWTTTRPDEKVVYAKDGVYQKVTIYEGEYYGRPSRFLLLDRSESGAMFLDSDNPVELVYDYTKYYSLYRVFTPHLRNALVLGGGAYSIPKALIAEAPDAEVDVAEIEPSFFDLSKRYFRVVDSPRLHNHVQDGRRFLSDSTKRYDLIFGDVYYSYFSVPPQFTTQEFFSLVQSRLGPGGVFIANMIGDLSRRQPSLIMAELKTFRTVFPNSYFFAVEAIDKTDLVQNITLVGYNSDRIVDFAAPPVTTNADPLIRYLRFRQLNVGHRYELSPYPVLTDDFSPVEYLTARVLQRSLGTRHEVNGEEIRAVADQQLRYGDRSPGAPGHARTKEFLQSELAVLAQETRVEDTNIIARMFADEPRRIAIATDFQRSANGVGVLIEVMRALLNSTVPPKVGIDFVFLDGAEARVNFVSNGDEDSEARVIMLDTEYSELLGLGTPASLETAARRVLNEVIGIPKGA